MLHEMQKISKTGKSRMEIICPHCGMENAIDDSQYGQDVICGHCQNVFDAYVQSQTLAKKRGRCAAFQTEELRKRILCPQHVRNSVLSLHEKTANFQEVKRNTMVRCVCNHAACFRFLFYFGLLAVPLVRSDFESAPLFFSAPRWLCSVM